MSSKGRDKKDAKSNDGGSENVTDKEFVQREIAIGLLREKASRYQEASDNLSLQTLRLNEELEAQKQNLKDINEFLTNELKARTLTASALEQKLNELQAAFETAKKNHEAFNAAQQKTFDGEKKALEEENVALRRKLITAQEFLDNNDKMERSIKELRDELTATRAKHEEKVGQMERKAIQDKDAWKRETAARIKEVRSQMLALTEEQLEETTKKTILENEQMTVEIKYQSRQTEKILARMDAAAAENTDLKRQLELSMQTTTELAKRNRVYQRTIKQLLDRLKDASEAKLGEDEYRAVLAARVEDLEAEVRLAQLLVDEKQAELDRLRLARKASARLRSGRRSGGSATGSRPDSSVSALTAAAADAGGDGSAAERLLLSSAEGERVMRALSAGTGGTGGETFLKRDALAAAAAAAGEGAPSPSTSPTKASRRGGAPAGAAGGAALTSPSGGGSPSPARARRSGAAAGAAQLRSSHGSPGAGGYYYGSTAAAAAAGGDDAPGSSGSLHHLPPISSAGSRNASGGKATPASRAVDSAGGGYHSASYYSSASGGGGGGAPYYPGSPPASGSMFSADSLDVHAADSPRAGLHSGPAPAAAAGGNGLPQIDELLTQVMSDLRPWGRKPVTLGGTGGGGGGAGGSTSPTRLRRM